MGFKILTVVLIKIQIFRHRLLHKVNQLRGAICLLLRGYPNRNTGVRQQVHHKRRYLYTNPHGVIFLRLGSSLELFQQQTLQSA
jgi:hypothetical protein